MSNKIIQLSDVEDVHHAIPAFYDNFREPITRCKTGADVLNLCKSMTIKYALIRNTLTADRDINALNETLDYLYNAILREEIF